MLEVKLFNDTNELKPAIINYESSGASIQTISSKSAYNFDQSGYLTRILSIEDASTKNACSTNSCYDCTVQKNGIGNFVNSKYMCHTVGVKYDSFGNPIQDSRYDEDLIKKVKNMTKNMPEGNFVAPKTKLLSIAQSTIKVEDRKLATNYIRGIMNAPAYGTTETYAMQIAFGILADHLFDEIRTKRSLSYAPSASYSTNINPYSNIYVSTTDPKQAVSVMIDELKKLKKEGFSEKEIKDQKSGYLTSYYMGLETNSAQTMGLGMAEVKGNWKNFNSFIENINKVSPKEVNTVFNKYIQGIRWSYLGDLSKVNSEIFLQKL